MVAKFEPSVADEANECYLNPNIEDCNSVDLIMKIVPNANAWTFIDMFNSYYLSYNIKYKNEIYGWFSSEVDTHMMTNLEWGAIVYLTQSKFGANDQVWNNSYLYYKTGCGASNNNAFNEIICYSYDTVNGQKASTTHNIYGVYDMSGGTWERVMGNYDNLINVSGFIRISDVVALESKYLTRYYSNPDVGIDYNPQTYGDAIYETSYDAYINDGSGWHGNESGSWYGAYSYLPYVSASWFGRGGSNSANYGAGLYYFRYSSGGAYVMSGFRPSIAPL